MVAVGNVLGLNARNEFSPVWAIQIFAAVDGIAPSGRIHLSDIFPRALPSAKMIQTFGL